jgi:hypothetical protein
VLVFYQEDPSYDEEEFLMARTTDALKIMDRMIGNDPRARRYMAEAEVNFDIAQMIYDARTAAG